MGYIPRIFCSEPIIDNQILISAQAHYLSQVLRLKPGDRVDLVHNGVCYQTSWVSGNASKAILTIHDSQTLPPDLLPKVTLAVSLIPDERWRWMLQKTTELGVARIIPLLTNYSKIKCADPEQKQQRWQAVVESAACQSEGLFIPEVTKPVQLSTLLAKYTQACNILLFERHAERKPLSQLIHNLTVDDSLLMAIGPEGGWSEQEKQLMLDHHFKLASLGQRILRTETAAIAALSAVVSLTNPDYADS